MLHRIRDLKISGKRVDDLVGYRKAVGSARFAVQFVIGSVGIALVSGFLAKMLGDSIWQAMSFLVSVLGCIVTLCGGLQWLGSHEALVEWRKKAGVAPADYIILLADEIERFNGKIEKLERFILAKMQIGLENTQEMKSLLEKKVARMESERAEIMEKLNLLGRIWGIKEGEFDDLSDILFEDAEGAKSELKTMLEQSFRKLSARVEIEEDAIESVDKPKRRLHLS